MYIKKITTFLIAACFGAQAGQAERAVAWGQTTKAKHWPQSSAGKLTLRASE